MSDRKLTKENLEEAFKSVEAVTGLAGYPVMIGCAKCSTPMQELNEGQYGRPYHKTANVLEWGDHRKYVCINPECEVAWNFGGTENGDN